MPDGLVEMDLRHGSFPLGEVLCPISKRRKVVADVFFASMVRWLLAKVHSLNFYR